MSRADILDAAMMGLPRWMGIALVASCAVIASQAQAQSLGEQLGSPTGEPVAPPNVAPVVPTIPPPPNGAPEAQPIAVAPRTSQPTSTPPDLVLTHDGGMVRGTIVRSQPGRSVVIQLVTGEVHEIPWTEIRYAGPDDAAPAAEPEANPYREPRRSDREEHPRRDGEVPVRFVSDDRLTLHRLGGTATMSAGGWGFRVSGRSDYYERECTAPCELSIEPGVYQLALSIREIGPVRMGSFDITRPGTLRGTHVDNASSRGVGAAALILGLAAAAPLVTLGAIYMGSWVYSDRDIGMGLLVTGCVIGGIALLVGIPLAAMRSGLVLTFE